MKMFSWNWRGTRQMLNILIRLRLKEMLSQFNRKKKSGYAKNLSHGAYLLLMVGVYLFCGFSIFQVFDAAAEAMVRLNAGSLYFGYSSIVGFGLAVIGSVFATQSQLFEAKDNDTLLAMPIRPSVILASRMISLYIQALLYESIMMVPAGIAWFIHSKAVSWLNIVCWLIPTLFVPMMAITVGAVLGWFLAMVSSHVRNKSYLQIGVSMVLLFGYFFMFSRITSDLDGFTAGIKLVTGQALRSIWPAYQYGLACTGQWGSVLNVILVSVVPLACVWLFISRFFFYIVNEHHHTKKKVYVAQSLSVLSPKHALLRRERRRLFSDGSYVLNAALGILMAPVMTIVFLIFRGDLNEVMGKLFASVTIENIQGPGFFSAVEDTGMIAVAVFLCLIATTVTITAPSLSLEGKTIWHAGILPVNGRDMLMAKVDLHLLMSLPVFCLCSVVFEFFLTGSVLARILLVAAPAMMNILIALLGMVMNVIHPKFDWTSSQQCIKRSVPVFVCMLGGFFLIAASGFVYIQMLSDILNLTQFLGICTLLMAAISLGLYAWLLTFGVKKLNTYYSF